MSMVKTRVAAIAVVLTVLVLTMESESASSNGPRPQMNFVTEVEGKAFYAEYGPEFRSWPDAGKYCESLGMKLASIDTRAQFDVLKGAYSYPGFHSGYWTSGRDALTIRQFSWDASNEAVLDDLDFIYDMPTIRTCLAFNSVPRYMSVLTAVTCEAHMGTLCEKELNRPIHKF